MRTVSNAAAFGLRPSAGKAGLLLFLMLLSAACSYSEEKSDIALRVDGIPVAADHLEVVLTPSDTSVVGRNCPSNVTAASNAICYRPTFQPSSLNPPALDLAFAAPAATGTFTVAIIASDRNQDQLATGSLPATTLPPPGPLQVTLH